MRSSRQPGTWASTGLLTNPQTLKMLADVVGGGEEWPEARMQTFEMASRQMVRDPNEERQASARGPAVHLHPTSFSTPLGVSVHFN